ncbi:acyloxyacyl hydrolase [Shewanella gaetbuli]|uniref:Acyloxyacyl hydrolase n=1 Tax=Shewanella gaetbuli TaxID=220752 RepID=A0A9X1ZHD2_9GAMM|nr:acyloxyacyl hydrolase [Shewanella gaetbuli]MCL1142334.1 acyloxyacyl hydrolase [Shewanella gaetbuli]
MLTISEFMNSRYSALTCFILVFAFYTHDVKASSGIRCLGSEPNEELNVDVKVYECSYFYSFNFQNLVESVKFYPITNVGMLATPEDSSLMLGLGGGADWEILPKVNLLAEGGVYWLEDHDFGVRGVAYKDYGGPWQFFAKAGASYSIAKNWDLGYAYLHISNGGRYYVNPSYDGHSLFVNYAF